MLLNSYALCFLKQSNFFVPVTIQPASFGDRIPVIFWSPEYRLALSQPTRARKTFDRTACKSVLFEKVYHSRLGLTEDTVSSL